METVPTPDADFSVEIREASLSGANSRESVIVQEMFHWE